ncbi:MAG: uncharacterized protein JWQ53_419 [Klenkia sp.]|nr:uncharacterized protein [Klenkia sp.]
MSSEPTIPPVIGAIADDRDGTRLGIVAEVYTDDVTGETTWLAITDGLHSTRTTLAPAAGATTRTGRVRLAVSGDAIAAAPRFPQSQRLGPGQETALRRHYGLPLPGTAPGTREYVPSHPRPAGDPTAGEVEMIRSAERLLVDTEVVPYRKAVLRVETTTEEVLVPVTITRQHARVEYVDIEPADAPAISPELLIGGRSTGATSAWLTLTVDEPVVSTRAVPVERVRMVTDWVTGTQDVQAEISHEVISNEVISNGDAPMPAPTATARSTTPTQH